MNGGVGEATLAEYHRLGLELKAKEERREQLRATIIEHLGAGADVRIGTYRATLTPYTERRSSFDREAAEAALGVSLQPWTTTTEQEKLRLTVKPTPAAAVAILQG